MNGRIITKNQSLQIQLWTSFKINNHNLCHGSSEYNISYVIMKPYNMVINLASKPHHASFTHMLEPSWIWTMGHNAIVGYSYNHTPFHGKLIKCII